MELYQYARPDLMIGKKILYVHGFASSGNNGTVRTMKLLLPEASVIAPDLPVEPEDALSLLHSICETENPDLIIGTSMGAMYAEQLRGFYRILVNPAFALADTILKNNGLGKQDYHNPREDGQTSFLVNKVLLEQFRATTANCFKEPETDKVYGLFGIHDTLTDSFGTFASHYPLAIKFDGEHYLNDHAFLHSVLPVIQWIDDKQEGRSRRSIMIDIDTVNESNRGRICVKKLSEWYDIYISITATHNSPETIAKDYTRADSEFGVLAWNKVIVGNHRNLFLCDYLITKPQAAVVPGLGCGEDGFMGTIITHGSEQFKTWDDITTYFERLGGQ